MLDANLLTVMYLNYQAAEEFRKKANCPIPALDSYKTRDRMNLPTSLIMAQRNVFGNHPIKNNLYRVNKSPGL
jgi:6-phosphogluconate dehydrogenase